MSSQKMFVIQLFTDTNNDGTYMHELAKLGRLDYRSQLEILHGVLNDTEARKHRSFFYVREPVKAGDVEPTLLKVCHFRTT